MAISIFNSKTFKDLSLSFGEEDIQSVTTLVSNIRVVKLFYDNTEMMLYNLYLFATSFSIIYIDNIKTDVRKRIYRVHFYDKKNNKEIEIDFKYLDRIFFQDTDIVA